MGRYFGINYRRNGNVPAHAVGKATGVTRTVYAFDKDKKNPEEFDTIRNLAKSLEISVNQANYYLKKGKEVNGRYISHNNPFTDKIKTELF